VTLLKLLCDRRKGLPIRQSSPKDNVKAGMGPSFAWGVFVRSTRCRFGRSKHPAHTIFQVLHIAEPANRIESIAIQYGSILD